MPLTDPDHCQGIRESLGEVEELLDNLGQGLARLVAASGSGETTPDLINAIFRDAHSLKGVARMLGFTSVSGLAHSLETLLDLIRLGKVPLDPCTVTVLEESLDGLSLLARTSSEAGQPRLTSIQERIAECCSRIAPPATLLPRPLLPERINGMLTEFEEHRLAESVRREARLFLFHASFLLESFDSEIEGLIDLLKSGGEVISTIPSPGHDREDAIDFDILFAGEAVPALLPASVSREEIPLQESAVTSPLSPDTVDVSGAVIPLPDRRVSDRAGSGMVRVDIRALDDLIALVGELVAAQSSLKDEVEQLRWDAPKSAAALVKHAERVGKKVREVQQGVMEIRLVPVRTLYDKLTRIVRRIVVDEGRNLELLMHGAETRLDKQIIEDISDPLMHLVRNCVDHGIETPDQRLAAGKEETGRITITASQRGNLVVIEVADDGRGIDLEKVRRQAVARGLIPHSRRISDREAMEFIFEPGFTTSDMVSEGSGRGVGMDVVKSAITALSGTVTVETESGTGSRFIIALPITLAIVRTLIIEAGGETYGLPVSAIRETVSVSPDVLLLHEGNEFLSLREEIIPVVRLDRFFGVSSLSLAGDAGYAVVVGAVSRRVGIMVDEIRRQHDLVLKPLGEPFNGVRGVAGAVELSDDRTILVLDPLAIIHELYRGGDVRGC
jgi:two-component system, chemotaxis family, sensor kinase CheA